MSFSASLLQKLSSSSDDVSQSQAFSGDAKTVREVTVADSASDYLVNFALDVSGIKAIVILSDQDVTMETNDGTTPDETINLLAGNPYLWYTGSYFTNLLATDITALYFSNSSGAAATVKILVIHDSTPA